MPPENLIRFRHMLDSAQEALEFVKGRKEQDLVENRQLLLAIIKSIEIIGEAAKTSPENTRNQYQQLPWPQIVGMRHRLVHVYFDIDVNVIWRTVKEDRPRFLTSLSKFFNRLIHGERSLSCIHDQDSAGEPHQPLVGSASRVKCETAKPRDQDFGCKTR